MVNVNLTRIVDALCVLWATLTSDLIGRALSRAAGFCRWRFQRDARCHWAQARHLLSAFADTPAAISDVLFWELLASDDVRFWHKADMPITLRNVRFRG